MAHELLYFNGIDAATGRYLRPPVAAGEMLAQWREARSGAGELTRALAEEGEVLDRSALLAAKKAAGDLRYWTRDIDPERLELSGWGVILPHAAPPAVREALAPLIAHRRAQASARDERFCRELVYRPGETLRQFLERHKVGPGPADPEKLPYYLLLVGGPEEIPYEFQFELDVQYAVGRVTFERPDQYARYAESVLRHEDRPPAAEPRVAFFGAAHRGDPATERSVDDLVRRLASRLGKDRAGRVGLVAAEEATKERLAGLLGGDERPDVLFTSTHGLSWPRGDARQRELQGALVTSDWPGPANGDGPRPPTPAHYFAASDVAAGARLDGMICFLHGCYTAGTPRFESFSRRYFRDPLEQAAGDFVSRLAQRLLAHERGGALAVVGHVDQTWSSSFLWRRAGAQTQTFESALKEIVDGRPVGLAMEVFGSRYAELSTTLLSAVEQQKDGDELALAQLWTAHHDARNFVVLGDPAVRLGLPAAPAKPEDASAAAPVLTTRRRRPTPMTRTRPGGPAARPEDLEIRIVPDGPDGFRCSLKIGARARSATFDLPIDAARLEDVYQDFVAKLGSRAGLVPHSHLLIEVGDALFAALFPEALRILFERTRERLEKRPLRLFFHVDPECRSRAFLNGLPWEWLYWRDRQDFLSLNRRSPVVRFVEVDCPPPPPSTARRLRVLVVLSERTPPAPVVEECRKIEAALTRHPRIDVEVLQGASLASLREAFPAAGFHVVHFIGHGLYAQGEGTSRIVLEDAHGRPAPVAGEELAQTLRDFSMLRLVFFNSCDTARTHEAGFRPYSGVANALLQNGIPAIVAMQFPISHTAAVRFSERFYYALAAGDPLDAAVAEGRQAIHAADPESIEWGTPVLFVRTTDLDVLGKPEQARRTLRRRSLVAAIVLLMLSGVFASWPAPSTAAIEAQLRTGFLSFVLAKQQPVIERLRLTELAATDLEEIRLAGSTPAQAEDGSRGLRLLLQITDSGMISLEQRFLPEGARISIRRENGGDYHFALDKARDGFSASITGSYRFTVSSGRGRSRPVPATALVPETLAFRPRTEQFDFDARFARFEGDELNDSIEIKDLLQLHEIVQTNDGERTYSDGVFQVLGGKLKVRSDEHELKKGEELRITPISGVLYGLRLTEEGMEVEFRGRVSRLTTGPVDEQQDLMPQRFVALVVLAKLAAALACLSGALALSLYLEPRLPRRRPRWSSPSIN
jgi:hypothetical protein